MSSLTGRLALADVIEQGWKQLQGGFLHQLRQTIEGLLTAERDRRLAEHRQRGEKVYRWGHTVRKCWQTLWGAQCRRVQPLDKRRRKDIESRQFLRFSDPDLWGEGAADESHP